MIVGAHLVPQALGHAPDAFTKLLLKCDGANGSTSFPDSSMFNHPVTQSGAPAVDTSQFKFGGASAVFTGSAGNLTLDGSSDFAFPNGTDFTIDFWLRPNSVSGQHTIYDSRPTSTSGYYVTLYTTGTQIAFYTNNGAIITAGAIATGTWTHIALARQGTSTKLFQDGVQIGSTYTDTNSYLNGASRPILGSDGYSAANYANDWVDQLRVSKGIARWSANFTPPTSPDYP